MLKCLCEIVPVVDNRMYTDSCTPSVFSGHRAGAARQQSPLAPLPPSNDLYEMLS